LDDFQYAARFLISQKYTSPAKLAINGASNGGLLVAACANQAPGLFGAVVAEVGVMDMFRFPKFTAGQFWLTEYGNPEVKQDFEVLRTYSPLHNIMPALPNIKQLPHPATLVMTADWDDRVVPLHSFKYLATLQLVKGKTTNKPLLGKIAVKSGHGASSYKQALVNDANRYGFIAIALGARWFE
jgi:prolyl oligopeptidase